jgi:hypothetical protein
MVISVAIPVVVAVSMLVAALIVRSRRYDRDVRRRHRTFGRRRRVVVLDVAPCVPVTVALACVLAAM